jgi:uncharacterized protein
MRIWLDQVREAPFDWDETEDVPIEDLNRPELVALSPVQWQGRVSFCDPGFMLQAQVSYEQTLTCNRCLKPITLPTESRVDLAIEAGQKSSPGEHALHESDLGVWYVEGPILETEPILLEQVQLNIPMKPLCRPDCQGLCAKCGADLNGGACGCTVTTTDPRWAALSALSGAGHDGASK